MDAIAWQFGASFWANREAIPEALRGKAIPLCNAETAAAELEALRAENAALKQSRHAGEICTGKLAGDPPHYVPDCAALRAERDAAIGRTALRCIEMAMWPQGIDDEQAYYGRMFAEFIEREFKAAIDAARTGGNG